MDLTMIDTHCHLNFAAYKNDLSEVIGKMHDNKIGAIIVGTQKNTSAKAIKIALENGNMWSAVGLHPNHLVEQTFVDTQEADDLQTVKTRAEIFDYDYYLNLAKNDKVVAIGENGLDYYRLPDGDKQKMIKDQQKTVWGHIELATEVNKPLIVHCRDAHDDQYKILKQAIAENKIEKRGVIHCFTGTLEEAKRYIDLGFMLSFTGILTFSKNLKKVAAEIPLEYIMIETDAPYLTPMPYRGQRNEPLYVRYIAEELARIKKISFEEVLSTTTNNAVEFFQLKLK
ncbi:TatD family deoxyribonuclease [Candidatus Parcubacteria bacterium]|nr:MAG: TatD family deoxyribonuclease [Candidatus Parcubacteria bacterium]